jgi:transmembrane sensor
LNTKYTTLDFESKISKYLSNQASPEEIQDIYELIEKSEQHRTEFATLKNLWVYSRSQMQANEQVEGFDKLMKRIDRDFKPTRTFNLFSIYRHAASFLLPILIAGIAWLYYTNYIAEPELLYAEVIAPPKTNLQITLPDQTTVWLSPESKLKYPLVYSRKERRVFMEGEGYFEVSPDPKHPFIVDTKNVDVEVLGTSFNLEAYTADGKIKTTLVRGSVKFLESITNQSKMMKPGEQLTFNVADQNVTVEEVNTDIYRLVKKGMLLFKRNNMHEVCGKLERWFMVPVNYKGTFNKDLLFTAKFEEESIETILRIISQTFPIKYKILKDHIEITDKKLLN